MAIKNDPRFPYPHHTHRAEYEATTALDGHSHAKVDDGIRQDMAGRGLIWVLHRASLARNFDRVLVMSGGKLREQGTFAELDQQDTLTRHLLAAE